MTFFSDDRGQMTEDRRQMTMTRLRFQSCATVRRGSRDHIQETGIP
ncbi:hypothetical protein D1AOALGA4SA_11384 [Olavius algarvensis Delta 1 endosymbiont]|nr:hypothetical protein D1AOALGA4SA_11384 [Olavius algarvensis Delta 1 endosymbiont]